MLPYWIRRNFNPRPPHRGRPVPDQAEHGEPRISTHAPRTGGDASPPAPGSPRSQISTHAPRTGGDRNCLMRDTSVLLFQPTPPAQGATRIFHKIASSVFPISTHAPRTGGDRGDPGAGGLAHLISTHAPRTGGDQHTRPHCSMCRNFNPRPPHRGRRISPRPVNSFSAFQPTPPAQGATSGQTAAPSAS